MDELDDVAHEMPNSVQERHSEKAGVHGLSSHITPVDYELETALKKLEALPFHNENQKIVFFERVKRLQDRHVIQIFKLGVATLLTSPFESSELLKEVMNLVEICFSFCYSTDDLKRVSFEYYASALKFCFSPQPVRCLSTEVVSSLLELVQILQEGNLGSIVCNQNEQAAKPNFVLKGTKQFFHELLAGCEERRDGGYIAEIVDQTKRFASADAKASCIKEYLVGNNCLRSDQMVLPFILTNWIKLLKLASVSSGFALALAKRDTLRYAKEYFPLLLPNLKLSFHSNDVYDSVVCYFVEILEEMNNSNSQLCLPVDDERLSIFFKHMHHSRQNRNVAITLVKLLATTSIPNDVLREVLEQFFKEEQREAQYFQQLLEMIKATAFDHLLKVLSLLPDGRIVNKVLKFWRESPLIESDYLHCRCLLALFVEETNSADWCDLQERAERIVNFLHWLPSYLLRFIIFWGPFLSLFIKAFPASFHKRPEVLVFIHKAVLAAWVPADERQDYVKLEHEPQFQFLTWLSQQCFSRQEKYEMLWLLMCCTDGGPLGNNWIFSINIIKQLTLPFEKKKVILRDVTRFAKLLQGLAKANFQECVENIIKCHTLELKDDILFEILDFVKRFDSKDRPVKTIPVNVSELLSELSQIPMSGDIRLKLLQMAKESNEGLANSTQMLKILEPHCYDLKNEEVNSYFESLESVFCGILKGKNDLREQFCEQIQIYRPLAQIPVVWADVAKLISLGSFNEEIDNHCCCYVLSAASDLSSSEMLQLFYEVRLSAKKVAKLLKDRNDTNGSECVPETFVSSLAVVVRSKGFSGMEKLLLVRKVCDIFLSCPENLSEQSMENALSNLIPSSCLQHSSCLQNENLLHLEFNHVEAVLDNSTIMSQLSRIPPYSLCAVISKMTSDSFSPDSIAEIYNFIGSHADLDQKFFDNLLSVLEIAIRKSDSLKDVLEILMELVGTVRTTCSDLIPLTMVIFGHLVENKVGKQERRLFLNEAVMKWTFSPNVHVLSYLEVLQLLWKVTSTKTIAERNDSIGRLQHILSAANENVIFCCASRLNSPNTRDIFLRKVCCVEFEWLVLYSSLSKNEAALAFNLIFHRHDLELRCLADFSDVSIEDCCIKFVRKVSETERTNKVSMATTTNTTFEPTRNASSHSEPHDKILTPLSIAEKVIFHSKRLLKQNEDLAEKVFYFWDHLFARTRPYCLEKECQESSHYLDDYVHAFLSILSESSSTEILLHWITQDKHHVCQCSEVILNACKHSCFTGDVTKESVFKFQGAVLKTMEKMRHADASRDMPLFPMMLVGTSCFQRLMPQLKILSNLLEFSLPIEVKTAVLEVFETDMQAGVTIGEMLSFWPCKQQALKLVERFKKYYQDEGISSLIPEQKEFVWQLLRAFARFCTNSCEDVLVSLEKVSKLYDPEDPCGFNRLPKWRQVMVADGFSSHVIDCWCVAFLTTPPEDISSRDLDSILDLNSGALQLVDSQLSQTIKRFIFPTNGFQFSQKEGIKAKEAKERLRLARLLGEFINTLKLLKPEENRKDAVVKEIVVCGCYELCKVRESETRRNELYIIHEQRLKALFTEVFGKQRKADDDDVCKTHKTVEEGSRGSLAFSRQTSYLHENLPHIVSHREVYQPLLVLLRRWLSRIVVKPNLASLTKEIVQLIFSVPSEKQDRDLLLQVHNIIQDRLLSVEQNQALMAQLQASGYNQNEQGHAGLWSSPKVECSGYLSKLESPDRRKYEKKLTQVLRQLWNEWKDILSILGIAFITVGENDVCTQDLFDLHTSLNEMEQQVAAVKKKINQMETEYLDKRIQQCIDQMIRKEQRHRARIKTLYKGTKTSEAFGNERAKVTKFSAVWENRFLENVKLCSERIPGCYAPNGFHSEKPVLCALSVDNRIVTIFKEEKNGNREEVENVEVKLYEAGMYVYALYTSGHEYVTDELWAAFYKMLLAERLVPRIVLSNESPGFDWIKDFVKPAKSLPYPWKWERHQGIVPPEEDYFEHAPILAGLWPAMYGLTEFVILTNENVKTFQFKDFEDACTFENSERRTKEMVREAIQKLKDELRLLHGDNETVRTALVGRLAPVIKETIKCIVDGKGPTTEEVEKMIDMDRLTYKNPHVQRTEESGQQYAAAILRACKITHCAE